MNFRHKLLKDQELLWATAEKAKMGGWAIDLKSGALTWTEQIYKIYDLDFEFVPTVISTIEYYAPDSKPVISVAVNKAINENEPFDLELNLVSAKGVKKIVHALGHAIFENGQPVRIEGTFQDITDKKQTENILIKQATMLRVLLDSSDAAIFSLDTKYSYTSFNFKHAEIMKILYNANIQIGHSIFEYQTNEGDKQKAKNNIDLALNGEKLVDSAWSGTEKTTRRYFEVTHQPLKISTNEIIGVAVFALDLTDKKNGEEERLKLTEELFQAQKMDAIGKLAGGIAHDFNNLLTIINMNSQLRLRTLPKDDPNRESFEEIERAGLQAAALTSQLLTFSKKQSTNPQKINLSDTVAKSLLLVKRLLGKKIKINIEDCANDVCIKIDPSQLHQIIMNLAINARDAMVSGGVITIIILKLSDRACLSFEDTGSGMDKETISRIFEPFFSTKEKGKGTGLGLPVIHGIVTQNNGTIDVKSLKGQGTTFYIYFPITQL